jgi:hypothetical protein
MRQHIDGSNAWRLSSAGSATNQSPGSEGKLKEQKSPAFRERRGPTGESLKHYFRLRRLGR